MLEDSPNTNNKVQALSRRVAEAAISIAEPVPEEPEFLHAVLCQLGLPRSETKARVFERNTGGASLRIEAGSWYDGARYQEMPLPYGTRPRLVLFHLCSEAIRRKSREVEVERSASAFLERIGISKGGESMAQFKRQMLALAACRMQIGYKTDSKVVNIKCDPIRQFDAWMQKDGGAVGLWPGVITLSSEFVDTLQQHAVPLDPRAIGALQNSALALDVYTWLAHRLCRVRKERGAILYWKNLKDQFGQEYASDKDFKREFVGAIKKAKAVYPDARIETVRGGLKLLPSPPPVKRRQVVVALPAPAQAAIPAPQKKAPGPSAPKPFSVDALVSSAAIEQLSEVAPGWDKYFLESAYKEFVKGLGEMPRNADAAFLGWVRKFTKGKRP